jgi:hypothetical protein
MQKLKNINLKRLWLLLTLVWVGVIYTLYSGAIQDGYRGAIRAKYAMELEKKEQEFDHCLAKNGTTRWALVSKYGIVCKYEADKARAGCFGIWCLGAIEDSETYKSCIKSRSLECRHIFATEGLSTSEYKRLRWKNRWDEMIFYLSSYFSDPLKTSAMLILLVPILLAVSPRMSKLLICWLTTKPKEP